MIEACDRTKVGGQKLGLFLAISMVFFGAALLFSLEPLVGRLLIPYFGGAAHVWMTCLMFFQAMLLLGYLYAHLLARKLGFWHLILIAAPIFILPLEVSAKPDPHAPLISILAILFFRVALPFTALSTTAVVAQTWFFHSSSGRHQEPYPLYAASNAGSLIALLGYAFFVEPSLGMRAQSLFWSAIYGVFFLLVILTWLNLRPRKEAEALFLDTGPATHNSVTPKQYAQWLLLSALPSGFLLAITNYIALEIGSFPFVWVLPLALYLASFVVTFRSNGGSPGFLKIFWLELLLVGLALYPWGSVHWLLLFGHLAIFFGLCLVSHGSLYERRPSPDKLTSYYLTMALGGWIGGALVALVAPFSFSGLFEYAILLVLFGATFWWQRDRDFTAFWPSASRFAAWARMFGIGALLFPVILSLRTSFSEPTLFRHRNFYGTYRIVDESAHEGSAGVRKLIHGKTLHGAQLLHPAQRLTPISYYYEGGPISDLFQLIPSPRRIAVVGLGSGTISSYARQGDILTYYEIDPDNEKIARTWFSYLNDCRAKVKVTAGDGRLSMQDWENDKMKYDIIMIDAFTGDGIPVHLLTREAMLVYFQRLSGKGMILFHVSNRYYDLRPVIKSTAAALGVSGAMNPGAKQDKHSVYRIPGQCVVLAADPSQLRPLIDRGWKAFGPGDGLRDATPWTDDYINILEPLFSGVKVR